MDFERNIEFLKENNRRFHNWMDGFEKNPNESFYKEVIIVQDGRYPPYTLSPPNGYWRIDFNTKIEAEEFCKKYEFRVLRIWENNKWNDIII